MPAPGYKNAFMLESQTTTRPHFVELKKNGKVVCDGCPSYASAKLCAHAVAASEKAGAHENYVKWLKKNGPEYPNLTSYVTYDSSKNIGKKNPKPSTAKRKGGRNETIQPVSEIVDRPLPESISAPLHPPSEQATFHPTTQHEQQILPSAQTPLQIPLAAQASQQTPPVVQTSQQIPPVARTPQQVPPVAQIPQPRVELAESTQLGNRHLTQSNQAQQHLPADVSSGMSTHSTSFVPQPRRGTFQLHYLNYCPPNTRFCFGCGQALKPDNHIPHPPFNMTVVTKMLRWYIHPLSGERVSKEGNVYFHVKLECIRAKQPLFSPAWVEVASWLAPQLTMQHILLLRQFGMQM